MKDPSTPAVGFSPLLSLVTLCLLGAAFGVGATAMARRFGRSALLPIWLIVSIALGSIGAGRVLALERARGLGPDRLSASGLFALLIVTTAVILSVPTFQVWRRANRPDAIVYRRRAAAAAAWTFLGLLLAVVIALILDLSNVPFIPIRQAPTVHSLTTAS